MKDNRDVASGWLRKSGQRLIECGVVFGGRHCVGYRVFSLSTGGERLKADPVANNEPFPFIHDLNASSTVAYGSILHSRRWNRWPLA